VSIVVLVHNEGDHVRPILERLMESVSLPHEVLVVYDDERDITLPLLRRLAEEHPVLRLVHNHIRRGPAGAIAAGFEAARSPVVVVTMSDGCDDASQIDVLTRLVERGVVVACASRFMRGGQRVGGPLFKGVLSRLAGVSLYWLGRVGTHDATNSFKAYSRSFVSAVQIESSEGFEVGMELVAKARRRRLPVAEIPTIWLDRTFGASNFRLASWLRYYLRWYVHAFGPRQRGETTTKQGS
jgi:dolichol-phosphate mannosyltransferase